MLKIEFWITFLQSRPLLLKNGNLKVSICPKHNLAVAMPLTLSSNLQEHIKFVSDKFSHTPHSSGMSGSRESKKEWKRNSSNLGRR